MPKTTLSLRPTGEVDVGFEEDIGTELYGCFSLLVGDSSLSFSVFPYARSTAEGEVTSTYKSTMMISSFA